ncbi:hypothetical protein FB45DRAFT_1027174 [Roridomyces roridus]|uniref:Uncharacterized protein n=1 Tax=Roridomyces roridus TaxID=1738132 RepID=A0AAD7BXE5_9AGAR|nr:hypothetical protein FB45DRAFT_1027174 [Roridomyces roridus]
MQTWYPEGAPLRPQYYFPPGPPALSAATANPNPPSWSPHHPSRPRHVHASGMNGKDPNSSSSSRTKVPGARGTVPPGYPTNESSSLKSSAPTHKSNRPRTIGGGGPGGDDAAELIDGFNYFKIGEQVRIRRLDRKTDKYSPWSVGRVVRPRLIEAEDGAYRRSYIVAYEHHQETKEREFSPYFQEITSLESNNDVVYTPNIRQNVQIVFAPIRSVYTPAQVLTSPNESGRVRLRILAGPNANHELTDFAINQAMPHTAQSALSLRQQGFEVLGNGDMPTPASTYRN